MFMEEHWVKQGQKLPKDIIVAEKPTVMLYHCLHASPSRDTKTLAKVHVEPRYRYNSVMLYYTVHT